MPVHEMLGGSCRSKIRLYTHCGGDSPENSAMQAKALRVRGYTAIKTAVQSPTEGIDTLAFVERVAGRVAAIREEVGAGIDVAVDFQSRLTTSTSARLIRALEPSFPMFVEEPCSPDNLDALARLASSTAIPIAAGVGLLTRWGFRELLEKSVVSVIQPCVCYTGGILETRKIASMAEVYDVSVAPHNPLGPVSLAASLQVAACTPNFLAQELTGMSNKWDLGHGCLVEPFSVHEGYTEVPTAPGLGIELNEEILIERRVDSEDPTNA